MNTFILCSGSWINVPERCRVLYRDIGVHECRSNIVGFRLIKTLKCKNILTFAAVDVAVLTTVVLQFIAILVYWIIMLTL